MKKFMKKCKCGLVVALTIALVGNSMDWSMLNVRAENQTGVEVGSGNVTGGDSYADENGSGAGINVNGTSNVTGTNVNSTGTSMNGASVGEENGNLNGTTSGVGAEENGLSGGSVSGSDALMMPEIPDPVVLPEFETTAMPIGFWSLRDGTVDKISGTAVNWIDRLDLSGDEYQFAKDLYNNLIEWTDDDGTNDYLIDDSYHTGNDLGVAVASVTKTYVGSDYTQTTLNELYSEAYAEIVNYQPYVRAVYEAFDRDHPEIFWLSGRTAYSYTGSMGQETNSLSYTMTIELVLDGTLNYSDGTSEEFDMRKDAYLSQAAVEAGIAIRDNAVTAILTDDVKAMSVVEQIRYFNDKLTKSNEYNTIVGGSATGTPSDDCWECITALAGKTGTEGPVCEGYARAFKVLCDKVGIPCVLVDGYAKNSTTDDGEAHMWNYVQVNDNWYATDVTWNDPIMYGSGGAVAGGEDEEWLLVGSDTVVSGMAFIESHPVENKVSSTGVAFTNGPVLSTTKYAPAVAYVAEVTTSGGESTQYADIKTALEAAGTSTGAVLKLLQNTELKLEETEITKYNTSGDFILDLNGYTLDLGTYTMVVPEGAVLTISDSSASGASNGTGKLTSCVRSFGVIDNSGTLKVLSGTIEATAVAEYTGNYAIWNRNVMEMSGGLLTTNAWHGAGISNYEQGQLTVTGGIVQGSTHVESVSVNASGIINWGDLTIIGTPGIYGGGNADGVYHSSGTLNLAGAPMVQGSTTMGDIRLGRGMVITITDALTGSGSYSVYSYDTDLGVFAVPGTDYTISDTDKAKFTSVMGFDISKNGEGKLVFSHVHDGVTFDKVWRFYEGDVAAGNYVLGVDVFGFNVLSITGDVTLCLNGHTLDLGSGYLDIAAGASLSVCDCSAEKTGTIIGYDSSIIMNQGRFTLNSGKIINAAYDNGIVLYNAAGTATINGGSLRCNGKEAEGIYNCDGATLYMNGGSVECIEKSSVGIYNEADAATLFLYGGSISVTEEDGVGVYSASSFRLSGAPVIETTEVDFAIDSAACILIGDALTGTESYTLDYEVGDNGYFGYFANASDASYVTNAKEKFIPIQEGVEVLINDTALSLDYLKGDIPISIIWEDEENIHNTRPTSVVVVVYANDEFLQNVILEEVKDWEYTLADRYLYDANGAINYTVKLNDANGVYSGTEGNAENGFNITASLKHVHELYLSQSSNWEADTKTIVILCADSGSEECDWSAEDYWVTINGPATTQYDGYEKTASTVDMITGYTGLATVSDIAYYVKNGSEWTAVTETVDAGTYKAEVTVTMGSDTLTAWVEFEITPVDGASYVEVVPYNDEYDPFAENGVAAVRVDILQSEMNATIEYSTDGGSNWSTTVPVMSSVGSLEVMVKVTAPNYTDYTKTVTAVMTPFDLSNCSVGLEQSDYYYTGQQIKPVVTEITDFFGRELPLTEADYKITYDDNNSVEQPGYVYVEVMNPNYAGTVETNFGILYYDGAVEVLYNGAENTYEYYNADVAISAEGYTVSKNIDGTYTDTVMLSGEGLWVEMEVYFKQDGTGYITTATLVGAFIDKVAPDFVDDNEGIHIGENYWNTLETIITYDTYFNETQYGFINVSDSGSGMDEEDIYYYIDKSGSTIAKTAEELEACNFVSVADNVQDDDLNAGTEGDFCIDEDGKYVVYVYVVDRVGNKSEYICTNGIVLDTKAPVVEASVPSEAEGTLTDTDMTFVVEADEDAIAVLEIQKVTDATAGGIVVDSEMTESGFAHLEGLASDTQIDASSSEETKYFYKVELSQGEEKEFTLSEMSSNETYMYVIWVFDKAHNLKVIGEELSEGEIRAISVTTLKTIPAFDADPTITGTYGDKLSEMTISQPVSTNGASGTWSIVYAGAGQRYDMPAVNGTTAYTVKFTPEDTDTYETVTVEVVPTVAKLPLTVKVDNQFRVYGEENPELTYIITAGSIVDANYAGRPRLSIALSTTATKSSDAGAYDITGTVTNDVNYDVTVLDGTLIIDRAQAVITVADGAESWDKTFGDEGFFLSGISTNSDGTFTFETGNEQVAGVDANGKVTINGAGHVWITVKLDETKNYTSAEPVEISVNVERAVVEDVNLSKDYLYLKDKQESIDLTAYVPADAGEVWYEINNSEGDCEFTQKPTVTNGILSYTVKAGEAGDSTLVRVSVGSDNYEAFSVDVTVTLVDRTTVVEREGSEVSLKNDTLTYGEALSKLAFNEAVFVAEGTGEVVTGKLTWETPELTPNVATTKATWVFTPDDAQYMTVTEEVAIVVKKAVQPAFNIVEFGEIEYAPGKVLTITTIGGVAGGKVTVSVPENNGVVERNANGTVKVLGAGTVSITAVKEDAAGNYEDATATYELTVAPVALKVEQVAWAADFNGEKTYNGQEQEANIVVTVAGETLVEGTDYTVTYANNTNAYTLTESEAGFDADKAPVVVVNGKGNYAGTVQKYFVIYKAEAEITVATGKDSYSKIFGEDSFSLSGISTNSDGKLSYAVANRDVVSVDANGKVTIKGAGNAVIFINVNATNNYNAADTVEIIVNVAKADVTGVNLSKNYLHLRDAQESIDLTGYVPTDAGTVSYSVGAVSGECEFTEVPAMTNGKLSYTVKAGEVGEIASFMVTVTSDNYKSFAIKVTVTLVDQTPVVEREGSEVSLKNDTLIYGEALSKLVFNEAVFVAEGTGEVVSGKLTWETPELTPDVATTKAIWVFTPDSNEYMEAAGEVAIVVKKATQPAFSIVALGDVEYAPNKELAVTTTGGIKNGKVTVSIPANNGVVEMNADGTGKVIGAGTVIITAVKVDAAGNYEDATATYELTVAPANLKAEQVAWAAGFTGEKTYTGQAQEVDVVVTVAGVTLVEGTDYTVTYTNNTKAYTLTDSAAGFDAEKAPVVVVTGKGNYAGNVQKYFVINKADAVITVEAGKDAYSKTFGEDSFSLSGISTNSDGKLSYAVANRDVVSVDANGKVTIEGAGNAVIFVNVNATNNYNAADTVEIIVDVAKADATGVNLSKNYLHLRDAQESMDLAGYVPTDAGAVSYSVGVVSGECEFTVAPAVVNDKLSYTVKAGELGNSASFAVTVSSDNYEAFDIQVTITLVNQIPVEAQKVSLNNTLTYGEALSKLEFAEAVFVVDGTDEVVTGTIAWEIPDYQPDVATTKATWVFTPDDNSYMTATGEVAIVVKKAEYPEMTIVPVKPTAYGENGYLAVEGVFDSSEVTMTVPENNGVVKEIKQVSDNFEIVAENAGTVTVTATAKDTTGNYKDGTVTYELTVKPAEIKQAWLDWAEGFDGVAVYTGDALVPNVLVRNGTVTLVQGLDYTVEYNNNEVAYILKDGDAGFDVTKAPKAVVFGKGNYEGEAYLCFVINKAENAPNMPKDTRTVPNSVEAVGQVSLPVDWVWQNTEQALVKDNTTVAIAVYNGADKGNYMNEAVAVTITRLEAGIPFVREINDGDVEIIENGWEHVSKILLEAEKGDVIVVDMNGATILPGNVIEEITGKDVVVVLEMDNGVEWSICGKNITAEKVTDVDLSVGLNTANIPVDVINKITGEIYTTQISLAHNGEFGYKAVLSINLKAKNAGNYAQLFFYDEAANLLKYMQESIIDENGFAEFSFTHASEYTIVIDDEEYEVSDSGDDNDNGNGNGNGGNSGNSTPTVPEIPSASADKQVTTSPKTGDASEEWAILMATAFLMAVLGVGYRRRKHKTN